MAIFKQSDFSGGLNTQLDAAKTPDNAYPLLVNGRVRRNVVSPTSKHVKIDAPLGNYQGIYIVGSFLVIFVSGLAYYADITQPSILFHPVAGWRLMDPLVPRIYAELVPSTNNLFNLSGPVADPVRTFNASMAIFSQALYCFDGSTQPQAILPNGQAQSLGVFATWTADRPNYVPIGILPCFTVNKLFLASPDGSKILSSVSGRPSDFVVNLNTDGSKGGDAYTTFQSVSLNPITAMRGLSTGEVLVGTLYGSFLLTPDYTITQFGEPYLRPSNLFPAGPLNEISIVDILSDTAFITQSGIHAFNAVMQAKRQSNNFPLGALIRGLITDPLKPEKAITQADTCAALYDDFAFFAMNTIHGYGCFVFDTINQLFHSLDLSFGQAKQFANTRISGSERLFFITHDNQVFEAFAGSDKNTTRIYLGEWVPATAGDNSLVDLINAVFTNVRTSGQIKVSIYSDRKLVESGVVECIVDGFNANLPIPIPFPSSSDQVFPLNYQLGNKVRSWKVGVMLEWNFDGALSDIGLNGQMQTAENVELNIPQQGIKENFCFMADGGYADELNTGSPFISPDNFLVVAVISGVRYIYNANGNGNLVNGNEQISSGIFTAKGSTVVVLGSGTPTYSLRTAENYLKVIDAAWKENPKALLHGGDFAYPNATELDVLMSKLPIPNQDRLFVVAGNHDVITADGKYFYNHLNTTRYGPVEFGLTGFFMYNGNPDEPDGTDPNSIQAGVLMNWIASTKMLYKFLIVHFPPYTNDIAHAPGSTNFRFLNETLGLHAVFSGHGHNMERFVISNFPFFVCGTGGNTLRDFIPNPTLSSFRNTGTFGYLSIQVDKISSIVNFKDTDGNVLDTYTIYP